MRLWHKDIVRFLPRQQLVSQWRECVCIAKNLHDKGTPNHILVNKVLDYPSQDFIGYCNIVLKYMLEREYNVSEQSIHKLEDYIDFVADSELNFNIFKDWHNGRYKQQCFSNLQEKYDCGGISEQEWKYFCDEYIKL